MPSCSLCYSFDDFSAPFRPRAACLCSLCQAVVEDIDGNGKAGSLFTVFYTPVFVFVTSEENLVNHFLIQSEAIELITLGVAEGVKWVLGSSFARTCFSHSTCPPDCVACRQRYGKHYHEKSAHLLMFPIGAEVEKS